MLPYILCILKNSGSPQPINVISERTKAFDSCPNPGNDKLGLVVQKTLDQAIDMGLVQKTKDRQAYTVANKWFAPETNSFQLQLYNVVDTIPRELEIWDANQQQSERADVLEMPCGPGMAPQRSRAQRQAIAIYRRMREEKEHEERERAAANRRRSQNPSGSRAARSSSRSPRKRAQQTTPTRRRSRSAAGPRSVSRSRSRSRSRPRKGSAQ